MLAEMALRREKVAERLKELRELNGLSQEHAAQKVGITHRQWQRWEQGESVPYPRNLDVIASKFGISIGEFFDEEPMPTAGRVEQLARVERKLDALLVKAGMDPADFDATDTDGVADIVNAAAGSIAALGGEAPATPPSKRAPARKRAAS